MNLTLDAPKSLLIISKNKSWNTRHFDPYSKLRAVELIYKQGADKELFIHSLRYENDPNNEYHDITIPVVMHIQKYKTRQLENQYYISFRDKAINSVTKTLNIYTSHFFNN